MRTWLTVGAFCLVSLGATSTARAEGCGVAIICDPGGGIAAGLTIGAAIGALPLAVLVADIVYAADGRLAPERWAITELVAAGLLVGGGTALLAITGPQEDEPWIAAGTTGLAVGIGYAIHGIASLAIGDDGARLTLRPGGVPATF